MWNLKIKINFYICLIMLLVNCAWKVNLYPAHKNFSLCNCVLLRTCESFNNFIDNSPNDAHVKAVIQEAVCYFDGINIFVCCPMKNNHKRYIKEKTKLDYLDELTGLNCPPSFGDEYNYDDYLRDHHEEHHLTIPQYDHDTVHKHHHQDEHYRTTPQYDYDTVKTNYHQDAHIHCKEFGNCGNTFVFPHDNEHSTHSGTSQRYPAYHHHEHKHDNHPHLDQDIHLQFFPHTHNTPVKPAERITPKPSKGLNDKCGVLPSSSVGSIEVYPWITRLAYLNTTSRTIRYRCMGTIVSKSHILTAAHCVDRLVRDLRLIYVRVGDDANFDDFQILETIVHPNYNEPLFNNDVALLRLVITSQAKGPLIQICLPQSNSTALTGDTGIVAGWSNSGSTTLKSSTIRYINLPVMNNTECAIRYAKYSENFETSIVITPTEFCAQAQAMNDVCEGDSGGPFMVRSMNGSYTLLGIVAFGPKTNCGQSNLPGVYMRVSSYVDWIINNVK